MALIAADLPSGFSTAVRDAWLSRNYMSLFTQRSPLFKMLAMRGQIKKAGYGVMMREPLRVPVTTGPQLTGVTNAYAYIPPQPMTGFTQAEWPLSEYVIPVSWQDYDSRRANGEVEMVRWVQSIYEQANDRTMNTLMDHLWFPPESPLSIGSRQQIASLRTFVNGGTTAATDGGASPKVQAGQSATPVVSASGAVAQTTVGNIPRNQSGAAYWCPSIFNGDPFASGAAPLTIQTLNDSMEEAIQEGNEFTPDLIVLPSQMFGKLQNLLTVGGSNGGLMLHEGDTARFGFHYLYFRGAKIVVDRRCPTSGFLSGTATAVANHMYCLNTRYLTMRMSSNKPTFKKVVESKPIQEELGQIYMAFTSRHLGNLHSLNYGLTV